MVARERIHWDHEAASRFAPKRGYYRFNFGVAVNWRGDWHHLE
jgi:hypothetical protein